MSQIHPLAIECVKLKAALGEAGLYKTMQAMDTVTAAIGWELAENMGNLPAYRPQSKSIPHCCPVCNGAGTVSRPPYVTGDQPSWVSSSSCSSYPCTACHGTGIVWELVNLEVYNHGG